MQFAGTTWKEITVEEAVQNFVTNCRADYCGNCGKSVKSQKMAHYDGEVRLCEFCFTKRFFINNK